MIQLEAAIKKLSWVEWFNVYSPREIQTNWELLCLHSLANNKHPLKFTTTTNRF